jgi:DNA mismatch repair protein MutS
MLTRNFDRIKGMTSDSTHQYQTTNTFNINPDDATPMVRQFLTVKAQHTGIILFYRMGDFYETFFEDALIVARVLGITLTGRDAGKLGRIPMAGIPAKAADNYLGKLLNKQFKVAICEQMPPPSTALVPNNKLANSKGLMDRRVVRILTSGTLTEGLKPQENLFLAAIVLPGKTGSLCGLAYCDLSTGQFWAGEMTQAQLLSELARIRPAELLVKGKIHRALPGQGIDQLQPDVPSDITDRFSCTPLASSAFDINRSDALLKDLFRVSTTKSLGLSEHPSAIQAAGAIATYLRQTFPDALPVFEGLSLLRLESVMSLNATTRTHLELFTTAKSGDSMGSLLWVLDKTLTPMGGRLLRHWLGQPLTHLPEIISRQEGVEQLVNAPTLRANLQDLLPRVYDLERLAVRVANLSANPRDLIALRASLDCLPHITQALAQEHPVCDNFHLDRVQQLPDNLITLAQTIASALSDNPPLHLQDGGVMRDGYHPQLDYLRQLANGQSDWLQQYEQAERERTGIKTLKVQCNGAFGYFIELSKSNANLAPTDYRRKQTLANAERFTTDRLQQHETEVNNALAQIATLENGLFTAFRHSLLDFATSLKEASHRVAVLDCLHSLATVAVDRHYTRPVVDNSLILDLQSSRHPVVEALLPMGQFVPNACAMQCCRPPLTLSKTDLLDQAQTSPTLLMITGPNMAGKSTYMRQVAIIVLLAQIGSFVPASYAHIGIVDAIYTRVGAVDDLSGGQSTFMVEMVETAQILNGATTRSLVILDEVGRGTSTYDGVSIAWSVAEYLLDAIGCRSMFATHYHELNTLADVYPNQVQNLRVCVSESENSLRFLHTVEAGTAQKSYGLQVAKMAGVPSMVIRRASGILSDLQKHEAARIDVKRVKKDDAKRYTSPNQAPQLSLF